VQRSNALKAAVTLLAGAGVSTIASGSSKFTATRTALVSSRRPGAELKVYSGAPHGPFITHMEMLNRDLLTFAKNCWT